MHAPTPIAATQISRHDGAILHIFSKRFSHLFGGAAAEQERPAILRVTCLFIYYWQRFDNRIESLERTGVVFRYQRDVFQWCNWDPSTATDWNGSSIHTGPAVREQPAPSTKLFRKRREIPVRIWRQWRRTNQWGGDRCSRRVRLVTADNLRPSRCCWPPDPLGAHHCLPTASASWPIDSVRANLLLTPTSTPTTHGEHTLESPVVMATQETLHNQRRPPVQVLTDTLPCNNTRLYLLG